jgi:lysophospholipid acyltransferase (LPLAT)-like uncharacterized protein
MPIRRWCELAGITVVPGATGAGGREALDRLVSALDAGHSTVLYVDGPFGPPFKVFFCLFLFYFTTMLVIVFFFFPQR